MIVAVVRRPTRCAVSTTSSHWKVLSLSGHNTARFVNLSENFGGGAGQGAKALLAEHLQEVLDGNSQRRCAMRNFEWREGMNMHQWDGFFDCLQQIEIRMAVKTRMNAALHADFSCATVPGLGSAAGYLIERQIIWLAA